MREILFRGKRLDNGEWIEGWYGKKSFGAWPLRDAITPCADAENGHLHYEEIDPATLGQFTGLTDKNGTRIFEGDVVTGLFLFSDPVNGQIGFQDGAFGLYWMRGGWKEFTPITSMCNVTYEIIGNIHDNPELMGGETT